MTEARDLLRQAEADLADAGVASPAHDAAELLSHLLGGSRMAVASAVITPEQANTFLDLVSRRAAREPLQHLTGIAHFRYVELEVGPGVFVPRPETELLTGWAIDALVEKARGLDSSPLVVDLCTGSGAIAKSIAHEVPDAIVHAVELSLEAMPWAERNLAGTGVTLHQGDLASALPEFDGRFDVVVCNPPYIPLEAWESVALEARDHDPHLALFSGQDGLDAMRALEATAARLLKVEGVVGAEHADAQGESAPAVFTAAGRWSDVRDHPDFNGRPRFLTARLAR